MNQPPDITFNYSVSLGPGIAPPPPPVNKSAAMQEKIIRWLVAGWLVFAVIASLADIGGNMLIGLNNDHQSLMDQTRKMLAGWIPYVEYTDVSPPLIHVLYAVPVLLAKVTGLPLYLALDAVTLALIALGLMASLRMMTLSGTHPATRKIATGAIALALIALPSIHQLFGDREHLLMVLAMPWFVFCSPLARREAVSPRWRVLAAVMAAIGFAIKPYFYVFYAMSVGYSLLHGKPIRVLFRESEHYIICGFGLAYALVMFAFFPDYVFTILPLGWQTYAAISWAWGDKMDVLGRELLGKYALAGIAGSILLGLWSPGSYNRTITYLFILLLGAIASYLLNGGWYYTQYPFIAIAFVLGVAVGSRLLLAATKIRNITHLKLYLAGLGALLLAAMVQFYIIPIHYRMGWDIKLQQERGHPLSTVEIQATALAEINARLDSHPRFILLSTNLWSVNLLKEGSPRQNVSRFDYLWPLPGILALEKAPGREAQYKKYYDYFANAEADDLEHQKPDMVIHDISPYQRSLPASYNALVFLLKNDRFAAAWKAYKPAGKVNGCSATEQANCSYEFYYRK